MGIFKTDGRFRTWFKVGSFYAGATAAVVLTAAVFLIVYRFAGADLPEVGARLREITPTSPSFIGAEWVLVVAFLGITAFLRRYVDGRRPLRSLGLDVRRAPYPTLWGCLTGVLAIAAAYLLVVVAGGAKPSLNELGVGPGALVLTFAFFAGSAVAEELLFRGYPIKAIDEGWTRWGAVLTMSVLFGIMHVGNPMVNPVGLLNVTLAGVILGLLYLKSGSLWTAFGFHFGWNFAQGPLLGSAVSGYSGFGSVITSAPEGHAIISGGPFGLEGSAVTTAVEVGLILTLVFSSPRLLVLKNAAEVPAHVTTMEKNHEVLSEEQA